MESLVCITVGWLYAVAVFLMLRRSINRLVIGLALLAHATNLVIFLGPGLVRAHAPIIPRDAQTLEQPYADPLPQALVLTAIVISFGVLALTLVLFDRAYAGVRSEDIDDYISTDR